ncbi:hypothetical protein GALL_503700 [mine drainage metagenome]|uniref:Uncharacterized protein n=1 Tax=mine drainage metagenome TaxID=410659 RepID=A0A1J5PKF1_9ZZZZ
MHFSQTSKGIGHGSVASRAQRAVVDLQLSEGQAPVVDAVIHIKHIEPGFELRNGRHKSITMESIRIQIIGFEVGSGDQANPIVKQCREQTLENQGIGDIRDMKLVKTDQPVFFSNTLTQHIEGVDRPAQTGQFMVHFPHEFMEMQAGLAFQRYRTIETVHQKTFAPAHSAVHIDTPRNGRTVDQLFKRIGALFLEMGPLGCASL